MALAAAPDAPRAPHVPVLLGPLLAACAPVRGVWVDGTFGAGGYAVGLLEAGADRVIGIDRDPLAAEMAAPLVERFGGRLGAGAGHLRASGGCGRCASGRRCAGPWRVLDAAGSGRARVFLHEGRPAGHADEPGGRECSGCGESRRRGAVGRHHLSLRRGAGGAADCQGDCHGPGDPADHHDGAADRGGLRRAAPPASGPKPPGHAHLPGHPHRGECRIPGAGRWAGGGGTRSEARRALAVVTFHSLEDRIVKRFFQAAAGGETGNRHAPAPVQTAARFTPVTRGAVGPDDDELAANPRARSAKLRVARRTAAAAARAPDLATLDVPVLPTRRPTKDRR